MGGGGGVLCPHQHRPPGWLHCFTDLYPPRVCVCVSREGVCASFYVIVEPAADEMLAGQWGRKVRGKRLSTSVHDNSDTEMAGACTTAPAQSHQCFTAWLRSGYCPLFLSERCYPVTPSAVLLRNHKNVLKALHCLPTRFAVLTLCYFFFFSARSVLLSGLCQTKANFVIYFTF